MLLSSPSGEKTQNHPFLASRRKNIEICVWGFIEDKFLLVSKCLHMFLFVLYTFLLAAPDLFCITLACPRTFLSYKKLTYLRTAPMNYDFFPSLDFY